MHTHKQQRRQDMSYESVCAEALRQDLQGDDWCRLFDQGCDDWWQARDASGKSAYQDEVVVPPASGEGHAYTQCRKCFWICVWVFFLTCIFHSPPTSFPSSLFIRIHTFVRFGTQRGKRNSNRWARLSIVGLMSACLSMTLPIPRYVLVCVCVSECFSSSYCSLFFWQS